jgi:DNA-binding Lrp family transcriptional regulator
MARSGLDALDLRILRAMAQAQFQHPARPGRAPSHRRIGRDLRLSPGTIRNRVRRMEETGVLMGTSTYPNPGLLGLATFAYAFDVARANDKPTVLRRLRQREEVFFLQNFRGTCLGAMLALPTERALEDLLGSIDRIGGGPRGWASPVPHPPSSVKLTGADRALISRLMREKGVTDLELAARLRISTRTLRRRMSRLVGGLAILSLPTMEYRSITGGLPADLLVRYADPLARSDAEGRLLRLLDPYLIYAGLWAGFAVYSTVLPRLTDATELAERASAVPGVREARLEFVEDHIDLTGSFERYLRVPAAPGANLAS